MASGEVEACSRRQLSGFSVDRRADALDALRGSGIDSASFQVEASLPADTPTLPGGRRDAQTPEHGMRQHEGSSRGSEINPTACCRLGVWTTAAPNLQGPAVPPFRGPDRPRTPNSPRCESVSTSRQHSFWKTPKPFHPTPQQKQQGLEMTRGRRQSRLRSCGGAGLF